MSPELIGRRIQAAREALGLSRAAMADSIGVDRSAYTKIEKGTRLIASDAAVRMCEIHDLTLDFIFRGRVSSLRDDLRTMVFSRLNER